MKGNPVPEIIAEFCQNHLGDRTIMKRMIDQAAFAGADFAKIQTIHSRSGEEAKLVLTEGIKGGRGGMTINPPLIIYQDGNTYTDAVEKMFSP